LKRIIRCPKCELKKLKSVLDDPRHASGDLNGMKCDIYCLKYALAKPKIVSNENPIAEGREFEIASSTNITDLKKSVQKRRIAQKRRRRSDERCRRTEEWPARTGKEWHSRDKES
jgi:hypothetical protein